MDCKVNRVGNDLFWEIYSLKLGKLVKWQGYDDHYWWNKVATDPNFQEKEGYRLNPWTNEVIELPSPTEGEQGDNTHVNKNKNNPVPKNPLCKCGHYLSQHGAVPYYGTCGVGNCECISFVNSQNEGALVKNTPAGYSALCDDCGEWTPVEWQEDDKCGSCGAPLDTLWRWS